MIKIIGVKEYKIKYENVTIKLMFNLVERYGLTTEFQSCKFKEKLKIFYLVHYIYYIFLIN